MKVVRGRPMVLFENEKQTMIRDLINYNELFTFYLFLNERTYFVDFIAEF